MKTDYYLNLCLQQAEMSPLHHRHGCIVVKGGKVIGKGFNDYRPGYDGGALKTGLLPTKQKQQGSMKVDKTGRKNGFAPFENAVGLLAGSHHHANNSLSMHSEMMAINSALSSSSALAAATLSHIKPPSTTSRDSKRKRQQQRDVINAYAQRICYDAVGPQVQQGTGPAQAAESSQKQQRRMQHAHNKYKIEDKYGYEYNKMYKERKPVLSRAHSTSLASTGLPTVERPQQEEKSNRDGADQGAENKKARQKPILEGTPVSNKLKDRTKHPKLRGADVYVTRLGGVQRSGESTPGPKKRPVESELGINQKDDPSSSPLPSPSSLPPLVSTKSSGSLHDELTCKENKPSLPKGSTRKITHTVFGRDNVLDSRPCYRCVLYMHSAGIRRVYWTNSEGQWETAKVRDLFDRVSGNATECEGHDGDSIGLGGIFVTKHEILMLRRLTSQGSH
ncbi:hypothetical protein F5B20DRAFT_575688 [Whalleya microplaca]|nr:hypothetical protein F5B20DRAFT_575688 [Whalleya microplaca]